MSEALLEIKNLRVSFLDKGSLPSREIAAVDGVNLTVRQGDFVSLVGQSGSGKSVTALTVCGLVNSFKTEGKIFFTLKDRELDLLKMSEKELLKVRGKEISYIFQDPASSLNPVIQIGEQLDETYLAHFDDTKKNAEKRSREFLQVVKIADVERAYRSFPHELSGGMKQRVMIAMALISAPRLLVADEPTTALDVLTESEIMKLIASLRVERRLSVLFITHNLSLAVSFSDHIYVMEKGRLIEELVKEAGSFKAREAYTKRLFNAGVYDQKPKTQLLFAR